MATREAKRLAAGGASRRWAHTLGFLTSITSELLGSSSRIAAIALLAAFRAGRVADFLETGMGSAAELSSSLAIIALLFTGRTREIAYWQPRLATLHGTQAPPQTSFKHIFPATSQVEHGGSYNLPLE